MPEIFEIAATPSRAKRSRVPRWLPRCLWSSGGVASLAGAYVWCAVVLDDPLAALVLMLAVVATAIGLFSSLFERRGR